MDTSDPTRFLIRIDLFLSCDPNVLYMWHLKKDPTHSGVSSNQVVACFALRCIIFDNDRRCLLQDYLPRMKKILHGVSSYNYHSQC